MKHFIRYIIVSFVLVAIAGCQDDYFMKEEIIGKGKAKVSATLDFKPMAASLARTRAAGDALKEIKSLHVLVYDGSTKEVLKKWEITDYTPSDEDRDDADAENGRPSAEAQTKHISFELPEAIDYGRYYIYAVANIPDLLTNATYTENLRTVDGLKSLPLTWNNKDITANGQMIGHFTKSSFSQPEEQPVVLQQHSMSIHAWLRRAASKVTVAYDGSQLKEGVFIYLRSVQIKDIPSQCYLGKDNNVGQTGYNLKFPQKGTDMPDGEILYYHEEDGDPLKDFEQGDSCVNHRVTVGAPHFGSHAETAPALYFYENMQGAGEKKPDKRPDANNDGVLDFPGLPNQPDKYPEYRLKDDVPYGTYIEVHAHYVSINSERLGSGHIIYRFMLGQNEINDYNAKRNCHYKLTLQFKNFANEADWHIEYEEPEPSVKTPEPYYISYLYNHSMEYPIKVNTGGRKIEYIKAEIIDNRWAPHNANQNIYYYQMDKEKENKWNGFLSLHQTNSTVITNTPPYSATSNKEYYNTSPEQGERTYKKFEIGNHTTDNSLSTDKYRVEKDTKEENTYNVFIPMYTRAKQLVKETGYTGNNPYVAYQRKAVVKITTKLEGITDTFENEVTIYQVRRIVNPKGIYRSSDNDKSFHVQLKRLPKEEDTKFVTFQSEGPWKAYIVKGTNADGISLSETPGVSILAKDTIHGETGSIIDFSVNFRPGSKGTNKYAIIRVEYHNYTCQHLIFVRQGNEPDNLIENGALWYAENMRTKTERASTPLDEGSLFKRGNWDYPIDAMNNKNPETPWINITPESFKLYPQDGFTIAGKKNEGKKKWDDADFKSGTEFKDPTDDMRVANNKDYEALYNSKDIEQGYGVLYGDDADQTADDIKDVYGYDYQNNTSGRAMRGCFVYNKENGKSLFLPIGASGYGHRKNREKGMLRYAASRDTYFPTEAVGSAYLNGVLDCPLFYDIYKRPGGIYWFNKSVSEDSTTIKKDAPHVGWDINYFTFDFFPIGDYATNQAQDAAFVRCVKK